VLSDAGAGVARPAGMSGSTGGFRMKVVLFCGGQGMRIREAGENVPKPMVTIGYRPILWHVMKYYAHFGHKDFVLCLGHRGDVIKDYFLHYSECLSTDSVLSEGGKTRDLMTWRCRSNSNIFGGTTPWRASRVSSRTSAIISCQPSPTGS
jgi:hypothetical protein